MDGDYEVYSMQLNGKALKQHTANEIFDWYPRWSKNGKLTYTSGTWNPYQWTIKISNKKGDYKELIHSVDSGNVSWSPKYNQIIFARTQDGVSDVFILDLSTKVEKMILQTHK